MNSYSQQQDAEPEERRQREEMQKAADGPAGNTWRRQANSDQIYDT